MHRLVSVFLVALATAVQGLQVGFQVDFGRLPYSEVSLSTSGPVVFNRVVINMGGAYNVTSGFFTAPVQGLYVFHLHFMASNAGDTHLGIHDSTGFKAVAFAEGNQVDNADQGSSSLVAYLYAGQKVSVRFYYGAAKLWGSVLTSFSGALIQA